jgi:hypothetical protein
VPEPVTPELLGRVISGVVHLGLRRHDLVQELALAVLRARFGVAFDMAIVSRNVPPRAAVITIKPAAGGALRTTFHPSG